MYESSGVQHVAQSDNLTCKSCRPNNNRSKVAGPTKIDPLLSTKVRYSPTFLIFVQHMTIHAGGDRNTTRKPRLARHCEERCIKHVNTFSSANLASPVQFCIVRMSKVCATPRPPPHQQTAIRTGTTFTQHSILPCSDKDDAIPKSASSLRVLRKRPPRAALRHQTSNKAHGQ
jgi:hypothetical protein